MIRMPQFSGTITVNLMAKNANGGFNVGPLRDNHQAILENANKSSGANATYKAGVPTRSAGQFNDDNNGHAKNLIISSLLQIGVNPQDLKIQG